MSRAEGPEVPEHSGPDRDRGGSEGWARQGGPPLREVAAFAEPGHWTYRERVVAFCREEFGDAPPPASDAEARAQARGLAAKMGRAGLYQPIADLDVRGCLVAREVLAWWSPLADATFAIQALAATPALIAGRDPGGWAARALAGEAVGAFAITEREAGSDAASLRTVAVHDDGSASRASPLSPLPSRESSPPPSARLQSLQEATGPSADPADVGGARYRLDGGKSLISNAGIADFYVLFASTDPDAGAKGVSAFVVPADASGLEFAGAQVLSAPHPLGEITLSGCRVPAESRLGREGRGFALAMATLDRLRPTVAAAACGMAGRALDEAIRHARGRRQFGRPLGSFQLVRERLAESATELAAGRMLAWRAGWEKDRGAERITVEAAMAKAFCTEAAQRIVDSAVQVLGGRGVLAEHPVDHLYRSVRALRIYEGATDILNLLIGRTLLRGGT